LTEHVANIEIEGLPWLLPVWQKLLDRIRQNRLPHALMLKGVSGLGKRLLADQLAARMLCMQNEKYACGSCKSCQLVAAGSHSDLLVCAPEDDSKVIKVDQVRLLNDFVSQSPHVSAVKVVILDPASALNQNAANALLKNLEEPSGRVIYIILDHLAGNVLPTIRSRCQVVDIRPPSETDLVDWINQHLPASHDSPITEDNITDVMQLASGAPLALQQLMAEEAHVKQRELITSLGGVLKNKVTPVDAAKVWLTIPMLKLIAWQIAWLDNIIRYQLTADLSALKPASAVDMFKYLADSIPCDHLFELRQLILDAQMGLNSNLNESLLVEDLLIKWKALMGFRQKKTAS
jgi:DNA polymerase-3 subunit delta'